MPRSMQQVVAQWQKNAKNEKSIYSYRGFIVRLLDSFCLDITSVTESLQTDPEFSECFLSLQLCKFHLRDRGHDFLLQPSPLQAADVSPSLAEIKGPKQTLEEERSVAFCVYLMHRMLRLLACPGCQVLHAECIDVLGKVLHICKVRSMHIFSKLATQLVHCAADLIQISEKLYRGQAQMIQLKRLTVNLDLVKESLQDPASKDEEHPSDENNLFEAEIELASPDSCELLQVNLTKLLMDHTEIGHFNPLLKNLLLSTACCQLELGYVSLKCVSMEMLTALLKEHGLPDRTDVKDYAVSCVIGLIKLVVAGCCNVTQNDIVQIEEKAAALLDCLVSLDERDSGGSQLSTADLQHLFTSISSQLLTHGVQKITTAAMRTSLAGVLCHLLKRLPSVVSISVCGGLLERLAVRLLSLVGGELDDLQFVVPVFVRIIMLERLTTRNTQQRPAQTSAATPTAPTKAQKTPLRLKQKRPSKVPEQKESRRKRSRLYQGLLKKLRGILGRKLDQANLMSVLVAGSVVTEVGARCLIETSSLASDVRPTGAVNHLSKELQRKLCSCWQNCLLDGLVTRAAPAAQKRALELLTQSAGCLLACHGLAPLPAGVLQTAVWILSLPWLLNDPNWKDLRPEKVQDISHLSQQLADKIDVATVCQCLKALSLAPKEAAPSWRIHVFSRALSDPGEVVREDPKEVVREDPGEVVREDQGEVVKKDPREVVRETVVAVFPSLLLSLGPNMLYLIKDLLHPVLNDESAKLKLKNTLASVVGDLACVAANSAIFSWDGVKQMGPVMQLLSLQCRKCSGKEGSAAQSKQVDPELFLPFLSLLSSPDVNVRKNIVKCLRPVFCHIPVRPKSAASVSMLNTCLCCLEDEDYHLRILFSQVVPALLSLDESAGEMASKMAEKDRLIMDRLKAVCVKSSSEDVNVHQTVLLTVGQIARAAEGEVLLSALIVLLENRLSCTPLVASTAYLEIESIAVHKHIPARKLFIKFKAAISKFLAEAMFEAQSAAGRSNAENILQTVARCFGFPDAKTFLEGSEGQSRQGCEKYLLPHLISKASPDSSSLLELLASIQSIPHTRKLITSNIKDIFSYLVRFCQKPELETALDYIQKETDIELGSLLRLDFQRVHNELLLHLSTSYAQVFSGLQMLSMNDEMYSGPSNITTREQMACYLEPRLLGVLDFFDSQLVNANVELTDKKLALKSLISIVQLMGSKHISSICYKIMNTLRLGLQFKDRSFMEISCQAWNCFVRSLELPLLGPMMFQILATLLPLLLEMPGKVADIISYMVVENRAELKEHFHEICFLPDLPELADANAVLKSYTDDPSSQIKLQTQLLQCIKGAIHESQDVRTHTLNRLRKLLREKKDTLYEMILGSETADPVISQLVSVLLQGCGESNSKTQLLYGQCLGELGALDPDRLQLMTNNPREQHAKFLASVEDDNFAVGLINEVIKAFLAATEPRVQNCSAIALQELLRIYNIHENEGKNYESVGSKLWKRFPEQSQEILRPHLNTKYIIASDKDWSTLPKPIFGSAKGSKFLDWVSNWTRYMISKVKAGKAGQVFQACVAANRHNIQVALYLLPHVVLQVLLDTKEPDHLEVFNEVMEVVNQVVKTDVRRSNKLELHTLSAQTIFSVLDYLMTWRTHRMQLLSTGVALRSGATPAYESDSFYRAVNNFICRIPQDTLAQASLNCKAYTRALMHFEQFITNDEQDLQKHLDFLQKLYDCLNEQDGVLGVAAIRQSPPTLTQEILVRESLGQQQDTQACYERAIQMSPNELWPHQGLVCSLMEMGQLNKALLHTTGILVDKPQWMAQMNQYRVEAAWKMNSWDRLESMMKLEKRDHHSWPVCIGRILLAGRNKKEEEFLKQLQIARQEQMGPLSAASMETGSYHRGYECIIRLHMLSEIEEYFHALHDFPARSEDSGGMSVQSSVDGLLTQWNTRLHMTQPSLRTQEPILTLRRTLLSMGQHENDSAVDSTISKWWLWSAKVARKAGYLQAAYGGLLQAQACDLPEFFVEKAKWLWGKGENDSAMSCLEKGNAHHFLSPSQFLRDKTSESRKRVYAQALLLYGRYSEETSSLESNAIVKRYRDVIEVCEDWEDGHFYLAQYYDRVMTVMTEKERPQIEFIVNIVRLFGNALIYGNQYIYQAMPRLLSLWLDLGATVSDIERKEKSSKMQNQRLQSQKSMLSRINKQISQLIQQLAPYQFFTAFPQLVSRICHAQPDVAKILQELIASLLAAFPQQAMWMMMAVSKSSYPVRSQRCREIFAAAQLKKPDLKKLIEDATKLTERLLELCEKEVRSTTTLSMSQNFKPLKRMLEDSKFSEILLPQQSAMTVTLPSTPRARVEHNPFPDRLVYIKGFEDTVEVLQSLARPKKITMVGSDGRLYTMLCKPKDDLRKDCRLMEFNAIVNRFLRKDAESRSRQLHIRTYTVTPLNEECGLLEWVSNTSGVRHILLKLYRERGLGVSGKELKSTQPPLQSSIEDKMAVYKKLLTKYPSILREWFLRTFPDPTSWYNARVAYARTAAVMSMIGYILGLGDRHLENILLDSTKGDTVHVDFNCLFNKGETFEWPECIPFRLTHNMVSALGPMGVEGIFRRSCEVTLRVVRAQREPLMSILKPFIYDPLVEWSKIKGQGQRLHPAAAMKSNLLVTETGEITNEQARSHVQNIEDRMQGILKNKKRAQSLPLSIEGHVNYLIQEATDERNLCRMYIGWAAFM